MIKIAKAMDIITKNEPGIHFNEENEIDFNQLCDETLNILSSFVKGIEPNDVQPLIDDVQPNDSLCEKFQALNIVSDSDNTQPTAQHANDWSSNDGAVGGNFNGAIDWNDVFLNWSADYEDLFGDQNAYDIDDLENIDWSLEFKELFGNMADIETGAVDNTDWSREFEKLFGAQSKGNIGDTQTGAGVDGTYLSQERQGNMPFGFDDASDDENNNNAAHQRRLEKVRRNLFP